MSGKKTVLLLFAFVLIAGFYYFKVRATSSGGSFSSLSAEAARARVLPLESGETIEHLTLKDHLKKTEILLRSVSDHVWQIEQPVRYSAESPVVDGLASLLKLTPRSRPLSMEGSEESELGFDEPRLEICVATTKKPKERCLLIGLDAAVVQGGYAKWEDESTYFLVNSNFLKAFDRTLYSLRKKQIFDLLSQEIVEIQFQSDGKERFLKRQGKNWVLSELKEIGLSTDSVDALLILLNGLYVKEFLDGRLWADSQFGLNSNPKFIRIVFGDGSEQTLMWGSEAAGLDAYYAIGPEDKTPLLVSRGKINQAVEKFGSFS